MKSRSFVLSLVTMLALAALLAGCAAENKPNGPECITSLDCEEGYTCEDEKCVALPDNPPADKDTAAADDMTDELLDDEEFPVDETVEEDSVEPGDDTMEVRDDAIETGDDAVETGDDMVEVGDDAVEVGDDAVIVDEDMADSDTTDEDMADEDLVDEDLVDIQPDLDVDLYVDTTPPTVVSTSPESDATGIGIGTLIEVTFSEPMNETTLTTLTITVEDDSPATVNGAVTYTAGTYTAVFTPTASLTYDTVYTATVTTGVEDEAGNGLAADHEFSFTTAIEEINECVTMDNPCDAQGDSAAICSDTLGGYDCACTGGFTPSGGTCQDIDECTLNTDNCAQTCTNATGSFTCSCISGYTLSGDGHTCDNINECVTLDNPCNDHNDSGGSCADTDGGYTCTCSSGYNFTGGGCKDIDECLAGGDPCDDNGDDDALCANLQGSYSCTCVTPGYAFSSGSCRDIDECAVNNNPCNDNGDTTATCTNTAGDYTCNCSVGWFDNGTTCDDTNECVGNPCDNGGDSGATCQDQVGDYTCNCSSGWDFSGGTTCTETNECVTLSNPCNDHGDTTATCTNTTGSYTCGCTIWYDFTDGGCKDIDECTLGTDTCDDPSRATCTNTTGGYTCACKIHYSGTGYVCTADTQTYTCSGAPANTLYYNGTSSYSYTQTWAGSAWSPADSPASYNAAPAVNTCQYKCAANYTWNGSNACVADTKTFTCSGAPANTLYYNDTASYSYTQTWSGSAWNPADSPAVHNAVPAVNTCQYKCAINYTWNSSICVADTRLFTCAVKPANSMWNTVSDYDQTWTGAAWFPADSTTTYSASPSTTACRFKCLTNYEWDGSACINSRTQSCSGIPSNAVYTNDLTTYTITQSYTDGGGWTPPTAAYYGDGTPDVNTCEFKCNNNYTWNGSLCVAATRTYSCSGALSNTVYYNGTSSYGYTQTWGGSAWIPADSTASYNANPAVNTCQYKCAADYNWSGAACINSRSQACSGIISNAIYTNGSNSYTITQSYTDGTGWQPPTAAYYDSTPDTNTCGYKCAVNYEWNGSACVNSRSQSCSGIIPNAVYSNDLTSYTITQSYTDGGGWVPPTSAYYDATPDAGTCGYKCNTNYTWNGVGACVADTRSYGCSGAPANTVYYNGTSSYSYSQTWGGSSWTPPDSAAAYNASPSVNTCQYKCAANYTWSGSACINSRTQACGGLGTGALYYNNMTSYSIPQTYTDGGGWQPAATAYYGDGAPDINTCEFKCNTNYTWNGSICAANTQSGTCTGLPANAEWNTVSTITQTWNGTGWAPTTAGAYNATASTTECRFKCSAGNSWNGSACVAPFCGDGISGNSTIPIFTEAFESGFPAYAQNNSYNDADWAVSTEQKHLGSYSLRSGNLNWDIDDYASVFMNKYTDGQICFWDRSDDFYNGEFRVYVDGSSKYSKTSGQTSWTQHCISVTAGYRVVEFRYTRNDETWDPGNWYVDDITFHNAMTEQCDGGTTTCTGLGFQCGAGVTCGTDCTWRAGESDCHNEDSCGDC